MNKSGKQSGNENRRKLKTRAPFLVSKHLRTTGSFDQGVIEGQKSLYRGYKDEDIAKLFMPVKHLALYLKEPEE